MMNWLRKLHLWHTWTRWSDSMSSGYGYLCQERRCVFCNRIARKSLK